jgi:hypothetical protein
VKSLTPGLSKLFVFATLLAVANVLVLVFLDSYDFRIGPVHLIAHGLFKPLLYVSGAILATMLARSGSTGIDRTWSPPPLLTAAVTAALYLPSIAINPTTNREWDHQATIAAVQSVGDLLHLFVWRQPDGFYRPITFLSFWADRMLWGNWPPGHHLQNIALHALNTALVVRLGILYGLELAAARWAGLLFGVAALNYEPVLWPGARFDLLAGSFTLWALCLALRYLEQPSTRTLVLTMGLYSLGVMSKESAYCFVPLFAFFAWTRSRLRKAFPAVAATVGITFALLAIRWAIFDGLGGYPDESGVAPHFAIGLKTFTSFFTRALPAPLMLINIDAGLGWYARAGVAAFAIWAALQALTSGGTFRQNAALLFAALLAALPAANLVDWIGPIAHNVRYVYITSAWIFLLAANASRQRVFLAILVFANVLGVVHNLRTFEWIDPAVRPIALQIPREAPSIHP